MRSTVKEEFVRLTPPRLMSLEEVIAYVAGILNFFLEFTVAPHR